MEQVHILLPDLGEVVDALDLHRLRLDPFSIFPVAAVRGDLADVDLGIEIRRKGITVVAAVAVEDVDVVDLVKLVLQCVRAEYARYARVKARPEQCGQPRVAEPVTVRPLPAVFELRRVLRLIVRRVHIMHARRKARVHNVQILIRKREIENDLRLKLTNERGERRDVVRIDRRCLDFRFAAVQFSLQRIAFRLRTRRDQDLPEHLRVLAAFMHGDARHAACADDHCFSHENASFVYPLSYNSKRGTASAMPRF